MARSVQVGFTMLVLMVAASFEKLGVC